MNNITFSRFPHGTFVVPISEGTYAPLADLSGQVLVVHAFASGLPITRAPGGYTTLPDGTRCNALWEDQHLRKATAGEITMAKLSLKKRKHEEYLMVRRARARMKRRMALRAAEQANPKDKP